MGGFPPIDGPYRPMLDVTQATYDMAVVPKAEKAASQDWGEQTNGYDWDSVEVTMNPDQTKQFLTLYEHLQDFDDRAAEKKLAIPRLCFGGTNDTIDYGDKWNNAHVDIAGLLMKNRDELAQRGWDTTLISGADHTKAMQPDSVLPIITPWLAKQLLDK